jgi:hypothetical protein
MAQQHLSCLIDTALKGRHCKSTPRKLLGATRSERASEEYSFGDTANSSP